MTRAELSIVEQSCLEMGRRELTIELSRVELSRVE